MPPARSPRLDMLAVASSQLDALETTDDQQQPCTTGWSLSPYADSRAFRHSGWQRNRRRTYEALRRTDASLSRLINFQSCGDDAWLVESVDEPGHYAIHATHCHDRLCLPCGIARSRTIAANVREHIQDRPHRFLTLTVKATDAPLSARIDHLLSSFRRLRNKVFWKKSQRGGVAFLEVKWNDDLGHWHPHLHLIAEGSWVDKRHLAKMWHEASRDSFIVDIRLVRDPAKTVSYVCKYASKPIDADLYNHPDRLDEAVESLHGRRLVFTFGTWRGVCLHELPPRGEWRRVVRLDELLALARRGDPEAVDIATKLKEQSRCQRLDHSLLQNPPPTARGFSRSGWNDRRRAPDVGESSITARSQCSTTRPSAVPASMRTPPLFSDWLTSFE